MAYLEGKRLIMRTIVAEATVRWSVVSDHDHRCYATAEAMLALFGKDFDPHQPYSYHPQLDYGTGRGVFILRRQPDRKLSGKGVVRWQSGGTFLNKAFANKLEIQSKAVECMKAEAMDCSTGVDIDGDIIFWLPMMEFKDTHFLKARELSAGEITERRPTYAELTHMRPELQEYWAIKSYRRPRLRTSHMHTDDDPPPGFTRTGKRKKEKV